jgi:hypothetical protein
MFAWHPGEDPLRFALNGIPADAYQADCPQGPSALLVFFVSSFSVFPFSHELKCRQASFRKGSGLQEPSPPTIIGQGPPASRHAVKTTSRLTTEVLCLTALHETKQKKKRVLREQSCRILLTPQARLCWMGQGKTTSRTCPASRTFTLGGVVAMQQRQQPPSSSNVLLAPTSAGSHSSRVG